MMTAGFRASIRSDHRRAVGQIERVDVQRQGVRAKLSAQFSAQFVRRLR